MARANEAEGEGGYCTWGVAVKGWNPTHTGKGDLLQKNPGRKHLLGGLEGQLPPTQSPQQPNLKC